MMKKFFWTGIIFGLIACGGESSDGNSNEDSQVKEDHGDTIVTPEGVTIIPEYQKPPEGHAWQINDYAENLVNAKIYQDGDDMMANNGIYYYSELDMSGGYANVTGAFEGWYEFVLWRMANGHDLVGYESAGCGPVCDYTYFFYEFKNGEKVDVTNEVLPIEEMDAYSDLIYPKIIDKYSNLDYPGDVFYKYEFPKKGTSMIVHFVVGAEEVEMPMFKLSWDKTKFSIEEKYDKLP